MEISISEDVLQAIEENRVVILPAQIGQTVYVYHLSCFNGCLLQKRTFWDSFGHQTGRCGRLPCHTKFHSIEPREVTHENIGWLLREWGHTAFATHEEAKIAADAKVKDNIITLRRLGFRLDENGHAIKGESVYE